jgi:hypothetical protein
MSDYISKSALMQEIRDSLPQGGARGVFLAIVDDAQTLDQTEMFRMIIDRVLDRLDEEMPISWKHDYRGGKKDGIVEAIKILKEECGISE